jgi:hypothetical protein
MKKIVILLMVVAFGCKKSGNTSGNSNHSGNPSDTTLGYTIINLNDSNFFYPVPPSDSIGDNISAITHFPPNGNDSGYEVLLAPGAGVVTYIEFFTPSLSVNGMTYDSASPYTIGFLIVNEGKFYFANSLMIKSLKFSMISQTWPGDLGQTFDAAATGTFDIIFNAVSSIVNSNQQQVPGPPLNETVEIKGNFSKIYAVQ